MQLLKRVAASISIKENDRISVFKVHWDIKLKKQVADDKFVCSSCHAYMCTCNRSGPIIIVDTQK